MGTITFTDGRKLKWVFTLSAIEIFKSLTGLTVNDFLGSEPTIDNIFILLYSCLQSPEGLLSDGSTVELKDLRRLVSDEELGQFCWNRD